MVKKSIDEHLRRLRENDSSLQKLSLSGCSLGSLGASNLSNALTLNSSLQSLDISSNNIGVHGIKLLGEALRVNMCLQQLILSKNDIGAEGTRHLADALKLNTALQLLDLSSNNIGAEGARHLADALKVNAFLLQLNIWNNSIGVEGARHLGDALQLNSSLLLLDIFNNKIGDEGTRYVADALKLNTALLQLNIWNNNIGNEGARYVGEALKVNTSLRQLNISDNKIGDEGARHVGDALKTNTSVQQMDISWNKIGDEGVRHLAEALKLNFFIQQINISGNSVSFNNIIAKATDRNSNPAKITVVDMSNCFLSALPTSVGTFTNLQHLNLSHNNLKTLPDSIKSFSSLKSCDVSYNKIVSFPFQSADLIEKLGINFKYDNNPLSEIPNAYRKPHTRLVEYLRDPSKSNVRRIKVMLIGEPEAGKTTFLKRLTGHLQIEKSVWSRLKPQRKPSRVPTDGVDIIEWEAESGSLSFVVFDFAGQQLYQITHQFFLSSSNTIFVAFFDVSDEWAHSAKTGHKRQGSFQRKTRDTLNRLEYWWNSIQSRAPGGHVCIVGTKIDCIPEKDRTAALHHCSDRLLTLFDLFQSYHQLDPAPLQLISPESGGLCFWTINSLSEKGVELFVESLKGIAHRIVCSQSVPDHTVLLHRYICNEFRTSIDPPLLSITDLLKQEHVPQLFHSSEQLEAALDLLFEWGTVVRFKEDELSRWVVLSPQWLSEMFRSLIVSERFSTPDGSSPTPRSLSAGHLDLTTLLYRAKSLNMTDENLKFVIKLFKELQIIVEDPNCTAQGSKLLAPGLLDDLCPNQQLYDQHNQVRGQCLDRQYGVQFIPLGLIGHLIVKLTSCLNDILETCTRTVNIWRRGILINAQGPNSDLEISTLVELISNSEEETPKCKTLSTRHCIRASVRARSMTDIGFDPERCRLIIAWIHRSLTDLIEDSYPGLKIKCETKSEITNIVPIMISCPECLKSATTEVGTFDYNECWSFFLKNRLGNVRTKLHCHQCNRDIGKKRDLIPEFQVVSSSKHQHSGEILPQSEISELIKLALSSSEGKTDDVKMAHDTLWEQFISINCTKELRIWMVETGFVKAAQMLMMKTSEKDDNWNRLELIMPHAKRRDYETDGFTAIASGGFASVFPATFLHQEAVMKTVTFSHDSTNMNSIHRIQRELLFLCIMSIVGHPNLIPLLGWRLNKAKTRCVLFMPRALHNLRELIKSNDVANPKTKLKLMLQLLSGLTQLHRMGIAHRDLKPENVLVFADADPSSVESSKWMLKITDFGTSRCSGLQNDHTANICSVRWTAPEVVRAGTGQVNADQVSDTRSDMFSMGYLLSYIWDSTLPHQSIREEMEVTILKYRYDKDPEPLINSLHPPQHCPEALRSLISQCFSFHLDTRPTSTQASGVIEELINNM